MCFFLLIFKVRSKLYRLHCPSVRPHVLYNSKCLHIAPRRTFRYEIPRSRNAALSVLVLSERLCGNPGLEINNGTWGREMEKLL